MMRRLVIALAAMASILALSSGDDAGASVVLSSPTGSATAGGATVTVTLAMMSSSEAELRVTITPLSPGYHIYSLALPPSGVDGLGVPTHIGVQGAFTAVSQPTASATTEYVRIAALGVALPVYPDGPVTLAIRVARHGYGLTRVSASYGLCSDTRCMLPVEGLDFTLDTD